MVGGKIGLEIGIEVRVEYIFFCVRFRFVSLFLKYTPDFCVKVRGFYLLQVYCTSGIIFDGPGPAPSHPPRLHIIPVNDELTK